MKKVVLFLLAFCFCITIAPLGCFELTVNAATSGQFVYKIVDNEAVITGVNYSAYEDDFPYEFVVVPNSFEDADVVSGFADKAFYGNEKIHSIFTIIDNNDTLPGFGFFKLLVNKGKKFTSGNGRCCHLVHKESPLHKFEFNLF